MSQIVTLTLSPVIDKSTAVPALAPEKKLRCSEPKFEPGGGGINIARAIRQLGGDALAIYPAGGHSGKYLESLLDAAGITSVVVPTAAPTRENLIVVEEATNNQYRFGMPGAPLSPAELEACIAAVESVPEMEYLVASGSLPPGVPDDIFARLAAIAKKKGARFIADTSGEPLRAAAREGVFLLKPNLAELSSLVGREEIHLERVDDVARELIAQGGCELVAVSLGPSGAVLVNPEYVYMVTPPPVRKRSTVGAGDSMVAGLVLALAEGKSLSEVLCFGVAAGTAATMNPGTELCHRADVDRLLPKLHVQRLREL
ncbi:6-phosphofructokinase 2 [Cnuella takakiae]|uniref:6-phosphofructokinase 2 n=1 Tax=Cnuella takakiae TaxID=1302690 RepID=A0A1M5GFZ2_9BACT|nr:1-phosphofructokinase family hexose kinase [Cnuella takakiae]OLY92400.1 phosphofructokinase [Cnuella takakiae]SHG02422.1 6-phosphofructokinase 2 [Cnuella takakiae]